MKTPDYVALPIRYEEDPRDGRITLLEAGGGVLLSDNPRDVPEGIPEWICEAVNAHADLVAVCTGILECLEHNDPWTKQSRANTAATLRAALSESRQAAARGRG